MKMLFVLFALTLGACTHSDPTPSGPVVDPTPSDSLVCNLEQTLAASMANGVGSALGCSGISAIQNDILSAAGKANVCKVDKVDHKAKGTIANVACPLLIDQVSAIALSQVPTTWGCSGSVTVDQVKAKLTSLCEANIKF